MASVYRKRGRWWLRVRGADGRWHDSPAKATTKPAVRLEALERERVARQQRDGLLASDDNRRRTFGELMNLWQERYGSRLRSQTMQLSAEKHLRPSLGKLRRGELLALQKEDIDLQDWTMTVRRSGEADVTKGGGDGTVPIPEPLRPYLDAAINLSPSKWVFPAADGSQRAPDTNLKAVLQRALGRAGIVDGYEHRCRKPGCGHLELASDDANRRCPKDNRALWIRPLPKKGIVFHSLRHTTATLLARAKVHPSVAQKILRHADIETTLAIYTHLDGIEDMRAAVAKLDFGPLAERAPAPVVPLKKQATFAANLLPAAQN